MSIKNFTAAFRHIHAKYIYNGEKYPALLKATITEKQIFAFKHGLLHLIMSANKLGLQVIVEKQNIRKLQYLSAPDNKLKPQDAEFKRANLTIIVEIISILGRTGIGDMGVSLISIPTTQEMAALIPVESFGSLREASFMECVEWYIQNLAEILEKADHTNEVDIKEVETITKKAYQAILYWFDDFWVPDFLAEIEFIV